MSRVACWRRGASGAVVLALLAAGPLHAQDTIPVAAAVASPAASRAHFARDGAELLAVGWWVAHAANTVDASYGHSPGWRVTLAGVRASWRLAESDRVLLLYTMDAIPAARLSTPENAPTTTCRRGRECIPTLADHAYGIGASPLGLHVAYRARDAVRVHAGFTAGGMWFTERVPVTTGSRTNFTVDVGTGVSLVRPSGLALTLGYRVHHISNGWTARVNPGIGAHMLTFGMEWVRRPISR